MAKITESTLENFEATEGRATGNTTRLIDNAIQIIFSGKICVVKDHHKDSNCDRDLFKKVLRRLRVEHGLYMHDVPPARTIRADAFTLEIELL